MAPIQDLATHPAKGDAGVTLSSTERVTPEAERVTLEVKKGDAGVTRSIREILDNKEGRGAAAPPRPTAANLVAHWNAHRKPGPKVAELTPQRRCTYDRALASKPNLDEWTVVVEWLNRQTYANAPGTGEHPTWRATLDFVAKPGKLAELLDRAKADAEIPHPQRRRPGDLPSGNRAPMVADAAKRRRDAEAKTVAIEAQAADFVLELSDDARRILERDVLVELEPWRGRMSASQFDDLVLKALPQRLITMAHGRPLCDAVAELKRPTSALAAAS